MKRFSFLILISVFVLNIACKRTDKDLTEEEPRTTDLEITVVDELGDRIRDASVTIYQTNSDYNNDINPAAETKFTNSTGVVVFRNLRPIVYYFHIEKLPLSNAQQISTYYTPAPLSVGLLTPITVRLD